MKRLCRILMVLSFVTVGAIVFNPISVFASGSKEASPAFNAKIAEFMLQYPHNSYWTSDGKPGNDLQYRGGWQCMGFSKLLVDQMFGTSDIANWNNACPKIINATADDICLGDYIRANGHSIFVIDVDDTYVYSYDCWGSQGNKIYVAVDDNSGKLGYRYKKSSLREANDFALHRVAPEYYNKIFPTYTYEEGWFQGEDSAWRWRYSDGSFHKGWKEIEGHHYYFKPDETMTHSGWEFVDGAWHYFDTNGWEVRGWCDIDGHKYYFKLDDGTMIHSTSTVIDGETWYFDENGYASKPRQHSGAGRPFPTPTNNDTSSDLPESPSKYITDQYDTVWIYVMNANFDKWIEVIDCGSYYNFKNMGFFAQKSDGSFINPQCDIYVSKNAVVECIGGTMSIQDYVRVVPAVSIQGVNIRVDDKGCVISFTDMAVHASKAKEVQV